MAVVVEGTGLCGGGCGQLRLSGGMPAMVVADVIDIDDELWPHIRFSETGHSSDAASAMFEFCKFSAPFQYRSILASPPARSGNSLSIEPRSSGTMSFDLPVSSAAGGLPTGLVARASELASDATPSQKAGVIKSLIIAGEALGGACCTHRTTGGAALWLVAGCGLPVVTECTGWGLPLSGQSLAWWPVLPHVKHG